jgi:LysM repeat protein
MRLSLVVNILLVFAVATAIIGAGLFMNLLAVPGGSASATTSPPNTGPLPTFTPSPSLVPSDSPTPEPTVHPSPGGTYIVQPGDTLSTIAALFGISYVAIAEANNIPPPYIIHEGDELIIPVPQSKCDGYQAYTVQPNDFLVAIGEQFSVDWNDIADFNNLPWPGRRDVADIRPNDILCIPAEGWTPLPSATL